MNITLVLKRSLYMFMLVCFLYDIVPYQESTTLQLCRTAAAVGNTIYVRSQMTDSKYAESITLACDILPAYTPLPLAAAATAASAKCQVTYRRKVYGSFENRISTQTILIFMFMWVCFVYDIVPYQERTMLQLYPTAAAVVNTIYVRSQMRDSRQHAESTTLLPCRTAATVGDTIYVRLACPRYAAASCLCRSLS